MFGAPYVAADEENTNRRTPLVSIASSRLIIPPTFCRM
jgi:hypothetical protein